MYKPIKLSDIPEKSRKANPHVREDLKDFLSTSAMAAEIRIPAGQLPKHAYQAYHNAVVKMGYPIEVMIRGGKLYMRKKTALGAATPKGGK